MQTYSKSEATSSKEQRPMETFCSIQTRLEEEQTRAVPIPLLLPIPRFVPIPILFNCIY